MYHNTSSVVITQVPDENNALPNVPSSMYQIYQLSYHDQVKKSLIYKCCHLDCKLLFDAINNFKDHMRVHMGVKPFECEFCPKKFCQRCNLIKHTIRVHKHIPITRFNQPSRQKV